ncbi:MAG: DUF721 domain-containing protein [Actinomycetales bacterium]|nr:DUF721 domain-containing protein [Actinomycetales bacterium]
MGEDAAAEALRRAREMAGGPAGAKKRRRTTEPGGLSAGPGLGNAGSGARPSARDPQRVGDVADALLEDRGWREQVEVANVVGRWRAIVGDAVADHTTVERFEEGTLVVRASSTAWATQVKLLLGQLRQRIAAEVGPDLVTEIVILGPAGPTWKHGLRSVRGRGPRDTYG